MPHNKHTPDDLNYLAELGFEAMQGSDLEVDALKKTIKAKTKKRLNQNVLIASSICIGALAGIFLFKIWQAHSNSEKSLVTVPTNESTKIATEETKITSTPVLQMDTVELVVKSKTQVAYKNESFVKPSIPVPLQSIITDSIYELNSRLPEIDLTTSTPIPALQLRYIANAPILFLHDLKVTSYHQLYFKKEQVLALDDVLNKSVDASKDKREDDKDDFTNIGRKHYYLHQAISDALYYFSRKEYTNAQQLLYRVKSFTKQDINCDFYLGMSYYYQNEYLKALKYFNLVLDYENNTFLQEAEFYKAHSLYELGEQNAALNLFKKIKSENGFYAEKAGLYLK
jgi:hypothetical protein